MKCFEIAIIDDQGLDTGFGRFLTLLRKNQYLSSDDFTLVQQKDYTSGLGRNSVQNSISFQIYTHNYGNQGFKKSFCEALDDFDTRKDEFDIYIFDLNFIEQGDNSFYPLHAKNQCNTSKKFKKALTLDKVTESDKSTFIAGLEFYHCLKPSVKPKVIYSAAQETAVLRSSVKLFNTRLYDTLIVDVTAPNTIANGSNEPFENKNDMLRTFVAIDAYLQSRQIAIINRQRANKIQELNNIIKAWNGSIDKADELLIPDNGSDTNQENFWSLRTLFPKQVNRIESGIDVEKNKKVIYEVLNELNFRKIYNWIVFSHGVVNGNSIDELCTENKELVSNRLTAIHQIESEPNFYISDKSRGDYKVFSEILKTDLNTFPNECLNEIRKRIASNLNKHSGLTIKFSNNTASVNASFKHLGLIKTLAEFGVYIGDIYFMYCSVQTDNKHHFTNPAVDYCPGLNIEVTYSLTNGLLMPDVLKVLVSINTDTNKFNSWEIENPIVREKEKVESKLKENLYDISLKEQAIEDYVCLFSNRYKAKIEIQFGKKRVRIDPDKSIIVEDKLENKTEYVFTIKPI